MNIIKDLENIITASTIYGHNREDQEQETPTKKRRRIEKHYPKKIQRVTNPIVDITSVGKLSVFSVEEYEEWKNIKRLAAINSHAKRK